MISKIGREPSRVGRPPRVFTPAEREWIARVWPDPLWTIDRMSRRLHCARATLDRYGRSAELGPKTRRIMTRGGIRVIATTPKPKAPTGKPRPTMWRCWECPEGTVWTPDPDKPRERPVCRVCGLDLDPSRMAA